MRIARIWLGGKHKRQQTFGNEKMHVYIDSLKFHLGTERVKKVFAAKAPTFIFAGLLRKAVENQCDVGASDFQGPDRTK
jgi:hypothetical protein